MQECRKNQKALAHLVTAEAEIAFRLAANWNNQVILACKNIGFDFAFNGTHDTRVVTATQTAIGGDRDVARSANLVARLQERRIVSGTTSGQVLHYFGNALGIWNGGNHTLLGFDDARSSDQFHCTCNFLCRLHGPNSSAQNALLTASHGLLRCECLGASGFANFTGIGASWIGASRCGCDLECFFECSHDLRKILRHIGLRVLADACNH
jgi:hypothetical protein